MVSLADLARCERVLLNKELSLSSAANVAVVLFAAKMVTKQRTDTTSYHAYLPIHHRVCDVELYFLLSALQSGLIREGNGT